MSYLERAMACGPRGMSGSERECTYWTPEAFSHEVTVVTCSDFGAVSVSRASCERYLPYFGLLGVETARAFCFSTSIFCCSSTKVMCTGVESGTDTASGFQPSYKGV